MSTASHPAPGKPGRNPSLALWSDLALVILVLVLAAALCDHYNVAETISRLTRSYEYLQLDELPVVLFVAALALVWFAWRRYREARRELGARRSTEERLAATLADNRRLTRRHIEAQEAERHRLARELHDELSQYLNAIKLDAVAIASRARDATVRDHANTIVESTDHIHRAAQTLIRRFRPVALDELGLGAALEHSVTHWRRHLPGTALQLRIEGDIERCGENINLALYRLVQEGLTNISRHARADTAEVFLACRKSPDGRGEEIHLRIEDDGVGVDPTAVAQASGLGLIGMRERVEMLAGELELRSAPGKGFHLHVTIPAAVAVATADGAATGQASS